MKVFSFLKQLALMLLSIIIITSCATIVHGTRQSIGIASNPTNAHVWVDKIFMGTTPLVVDMSRKDNHFVRIEMMGYQPYEIVFSKKVSGWIFGNIVFGGVIGLAIDAISGGIYMLTPEQIQAELLCNRTAYSEKSNSSYITVVLKPNPSWKKIGNMIAVSDQITEQTSNSI